MFEKSQRAENSMKPRKGRLEASREFLHRDGTIQKEEEEEECHEWAIYT